MMRYSVLVALVGCTSDVGGSTDERIPINSGSFAPLICTGGAAGDPTCPVNHVEFAFESPLRLTFVLSPTAESAQLSSLFLSAGAAVHLENVRLEARCADCVPYSTVLAESIDLDTTGAALPDVALGFPFQPTYSLAFAAEAVR